MGEGTTTVTFFTTLFNAFDQNLLQTINTGSAAIISAITPLVGAAFSIYVLLITLSYWGGRNEEPIVDFMKRMLAWGAILTFGMNITYYSEYVVPFFNGLGNDLATALSGTTSTGSALDSISTAYVSAMWTILQNSSGIEGTLDALAFIIITLLTAVPFLAISAAFIILAQFALSFLLALGPLFFALALFPPTRRFFESWIGQCMNYTFLVALFAAAGMLEINFAQSMVPSQMTLLALFQLVMMGIVFIILSLNLPGLASSLGGGVGISSMVGKIGGAAGAALKAIADKAGGGDDDESGGSMSEAGEE